MIQKTLNGRPVYAKKVEKRTYYSDQDSFMYFSNDAWKIGFFMGDPSEMWSESQGPERFS